MFKHLLAKRGLSLDRLHVLLELDASGSLAKAASGDEVRQSQYSKQLRLLSEYFGVALTERNGRELRLTEAGHRLLLLARAAFNGLDDFQKDCDGQPLTLTIGAGDSILQWVLLPKLGRILKRLPNTHITLKNLRNSEAAEGLEDLKLEFACLREDAVPVRHRKERILNLGYSVFVPRALVPSGRPDHLKVLQSVPVIHRNPTGSLSKRLQAMADREGFRINYRATCETFPQACRAVLTGGFASILPTVVKNNDLSSQDFVEVEWPALKSESRWIALSANPKMLSLRPSLEKVLRVLKEELRVG
jgi:DNA-binding transcriptional LysR family regulator